MGFRPGDDHDRGPLYNRIPIHIIKHQGWDRLRLDTKRNAAKDFNLDGLQFAEEVKSSRLRMPCSAADGNGRPAPKGVRGSIPADAKAQWLADNRQFAPWHHRREAMIATDGSPSNPHEMPAGYTAVNNSTTAPAAPLATAGTAESPDGSSSSWPRPWLRLPTA